MSEDLKFIIELEYDPTKNSELGNTASKLRINETDPGATVLDGAAPRALEAGSVDGTTSYLSLLPTTIQPVGQGRTLFVWHASFHPSIGRRFQSVRVTFKLSAPEGQLDIVAHAPRRSFGGSTRESITAKWGLELPLKITAAGMAELGPMPSITRAVEKEVEHAFTITGTARGSPHKTTCVWTVEENASSGRGIPSEVQFAMLLNHSSSIQCDVNIVAWTAGGALPPHYLKTRTLPENRRKFIDPSKYSGKLHEYDLRQGELDCNRLLSSWTGAVKGALLEFQQPVVNP